MKNLFIALGLIITICLVNFFVSMSLWRPTDKDFTYFLGVLFSIAILYSAMLLAEADRSFRGKDFWQVVNLGVRFALPVAITAMGMWTMYMGQHELRVLPMQTQLNFTLIGQLLLPGVTAYFGLMYHHVPRVIPYEWLAYRRSLGATDY